MTKIHPTCVQVKNALRSLGAVTTQNGLPARTVTPRQISEQLQGSITSGCIQRWLRLLVVDGQVKRETVNIENTRRTAYGYWLVGGVSC